MRKFDFVNNKASDAASFGPGGAVANLSALEGANDDDLAMSMVMNAKVMVPLVGNNNY